MTDHDLEDRLRDTFASAEPSDELVASARGTAVAAAASRAPVIRRARGRRRRTRDPRRRRPHRGRGRRDGGRRTQREAAGRPGHARDPRGHRRVGGPRERPLALPGRGCAAHPDRPAPALVALPARHHLRRGPEGPGGIGDRRRDPPRRGPRRPAAAARRHLAPLALGPPPRPERSGRLLTTRGADPATGLHDPRLGVGQGGRAHREGPGGGNADRRGRRPAGDHRRRPHSPPARGSRACGPAVSTRLRPRAPPQPPEPPRGRPAVPAPDDPSSTPSATPGASAGSSSGRLRQRLAGRFHGRSHHPGVQETEPPFIAASIGVTSLRPPRPGGRGSIGRVDEIDPVGCAASRRTLGASGEVGRRPRPPVRPPTVSRATALPLYPGATPIERRCLRGGGTGGGASRSRSIPAVRACKRRMKRCPGAHARPIDHGPRGRIRQGSDRRILARRRGPRRAASKVVR